MLYPNIETGHVFNRADREHRYAKGVRGAQWMWWNRIFMLETMIMDEGLRQKLYDFVHPELNFNVAKKMIRQHYDNVKRVREANRLKFKNNHTIFTTKFDYCFDI